MEDKRFVNHICQQTHPKPNCKGSVFLLPWLLIRLYAHRLRAADHLRRSITLSALGISNTEHKRLVGFFHPYCNAGGGGERVLWTAIAALQRNERDIVSIVYTGDVDTSKQAIIDRIKSRFDIVLDPSTLHFVFLKSRSMIEDSAWPRFTLLGQSLGSMYLAWEAVSLLMPDLYIDTMGYAFTFHVVSTLCQVPIGAYIHYPTISVNMIARVRTRKRGHTNTDAISTSAMLTWGKLLYYRIFMYYYAISVRSASFIMVNSSWTKNHIDAILQHSDPILDAIHFLPPFSLIHLFKNTQGLTTARTVYPPCDTREMAKFPLEDRDLVILSVAQFRPEKDHAAQLMAFYRLLSAYPQHREQNVKLVLLGGSRNAHDAARVEGLRQLAKDLDIERQVEFVVNASYSDMLGRLSKAAIGLSTMIDEHFGINVVEFMAAGAIPVTHASGGPLEDIVVPFNGEPTGYHADDSDSFADALHTVLTLPAEEQLAMRRRARAWAVQRFSEEEFERSWNASGWHTWLS